MPTAVLAPVQLADRELYEEMVGRLKQDDSSVPVRHRGYWYAVHYEPGRQYPILCARADHPRGARRSFCSIATCSRPVSLSFSSAATK